MVFASVDVYFAVVVVVGEGLVGGKMILRGPTSVEEHKQQ